MLLTRYIPLKYKHVVRLPYIHPKCSSNHRQEEREQYPYYTNREPKALLTFLAPY